VTITETALKELAERQREKLERIANVRVPPPPSNLKTEAERVAYRMGVEAMKDAVKAAKREI
jgi:hypothetical protein